MRIRLLDRRCGLKLCHSQAAVQDAAFGVVAVAVIQRPSSSHSAATPAMIATASNVHASSAYNPSAIYHPHYQAATTTIRDLTHRKQSALTHIVAELQIESLTSHTIHPPCAAQYHRNHADTRSQDHHRPLLRTSNPAPLPSHNTITTALNHHHQTTY